MPDATVPGMTAPCEQARGSACVNRAARPAVCLERALALLVPPLLILAALLACVAAVRADDRRLAMPPQEGEYVHAPPSIESLHSDESIHPELRKVILRGYDIFTDTQQFRGRYVFNDMNCRSCHPGDGRVAWSGPVWPVAISFPAFRGKNQHVNSLEERISGCFAYSMNGRPPAYGSDDMLALVAYHQWMATGARVYQTRIYGRGYRHLGTATPDGTSRERGEALYRDKCAVCHGREGEGYRSDDYRVFPALWGDRSYNWGSGMSRIFTAASFIHLNMPPQQFGSLSEQDAWDLALFINAHERPQDPRFVGSAAQTRERHLNFHRHTLYGTRVDERVLGEHNNTGDKPFLRPEVIGPRTFGPGDGSTTP
jgi:thiosulfate dehydrogenase